MPPRQVSVLSFLCVFFMVFFLFSGCAGSDESGSSSAQVMVEGPLPKLSAKEVKALLPDTVGKGQPIILDFHSKFCLACQKIKPKLDKAVADNPAVKLVKLDIQHPTESDKALLKAFQVTTVPYVAFINAEGDVKRVFLEDAEPARIEAAVADILPDNKNTGSAQPDKNDAGKSS